MRNSPPGTSASSGSDRRTSVAKRIAHQGFRLHFRPMKLEPFALERFQSIWENSVAWNLAESGVHPLSVGELLAMSDDARALPDVALGYPQTNGTIDLRAGDCGDVSGRDARSRRRSPTAAPKPTASLLMRLVEPGDRVVMHDAELHAGERPRPRHSGATFVPWPLRRQTANGDAARRWTRRSRRLDGLVTPKTRADPRSAIPNNPTGARFDAPTLDAICRIAASVGAWVITDEIYRGAERDGGRHADRLGPLRACDRHAAASRRPMVCPGCASAGSSRRRRRRRRSGASTTTRRSRPARSTIGWRGSRSRRPPHAAARAHADDRSRQLSDRAGLDRASRDGLDHAAPDAGAIVFVRYRHPVSSTALVDAAARGAERAARARRPLRHGRLSSHRLWLGPAYLTRALVDRRRVPRRAA